MNVDLFERINHHDVEAVHCFSDKKTGLQALIAIHDTTLGPALGGCRFIHYDSSDEALIDVLRLARAMSYKAALAGLPLGGGKSVLIKPQNIIEPRCPLPSFWTLY